MEVPQIELDDFVEIKKDTRRTTGLITPNLVRITSNYMSLGKDVVQSIVDGGRYAKIAYSPKHQALMVSGTQDPSEGYVLKLEPSGIASMGIPKPLQHLHAPRGDYILVEGHENVYRLVKNSVRK